MSRILRFIAIVGCVCMAACTTEGGDVQHINGNTMKVLRLGGGEVNDQHSTMLKVRCASSEEDTTYWVSRNEQKQLFRFCLGWYIGDSVKVLEMSDLLRKEFISKIGFMPKYIHLKQAITNPAYERLFHPLIDVMETERIIDYLESRGLVLGYIDEEGAWPILSTTTGVGASRETVRVRLSAQLLNGDRIMGMLQDQEALEFDLKSPDQITEGLKYALEVLPVGEHVVLVPSFLAFGVDGSSTGIVGPNEPILYEIEILD